MDHEEWVHMKILSLAVGGTRILLYAMRNKVRTVS